MPVETVSACLLNSPSQLTNLEPQSVTLTQTPASTPGSTFIADEEKYLTTKNNKTTKNNTTDKNKDVRSKSNKKKLVAKKNKEEEYRDLKRKWNVTIWNLAPCFMAVISIIQVLVFMLAPDTISKLLRFEPLLRDQLWRFVSYMLLHWSKTHLVLNVIIQCLIAIPLEVEQGGLRTVAVYIGGGVFGALGACLLQPQPMVGASAGVYALLVSHLAHLYLNFSIVKYRKYRIFSVSVLAISDFIFCAFHARTAGHPPISLGAHASGGIAGALLGLLIYRGAHDTDEKLYYIRRWVRIVAGVTIFLLFGACIVILSVLPQRFFVR